VSCPGKGLSLETEIMFQKHNADHSELKELILCLFMMVINPSLIVTYGDAGVVYSTRQSRRYDTHKTDNLHYM
jgi:hypothetical protein